LGGEIGAVATPARKIEEQRIAAQSPGLGVVDGALTVVGLDKDHGKILPSGFGTVYVTGGDWLIQNRKIAIFSARSGKNGAVVHTQITIMWYSIGCIVIFRIEVFAHA
jgi:hypothetical protein